MSPGSRLNVILNNTFLAVCVTFLAYRYGERYYRKWEEERQSKEVQAQASGSTKKE